MNLGPANPFAGMASANNQAASGVNNDVLDAEYYLNNYEPQLLETLQQNGSSSEAAEYLRNMAKSDPVYRELYVQLLAERENQERAYKWYEDFNKSYYQRSTEDLKKAGLNPWLALQSLGSSGTGSVSSAGTWSGASASGVKVQKESNDIKLGTGIASVIAGVIGALIIAML